MAEGYLVTPSWGGSQGLLPVSSPHDHSYVPARQKPQLGTRCVPYPNLQVGLGNCEVVAGKKRGSGILLEGVKLPELLSVTHSVLSHH